MFSEKDRNVFQEKPPSVFHPLQFAYFQALQFIGPDRAYPKNYKKSSDSRTPSEKGCSKFIWI